MCIGDHIRGWALWQQRPSLILYCLGTTSAAILTTLAVVAAAVSTASVRTADLVTLGVLVGLGVTQAELGRQIERTRPRTHGTVHINMTSVWFLPAVLLLPPALVAIAVAVLYGHLRIRSSWYSRTPALLFRSAINFAVVAMTCYITGAAVAATGNGDLRAAAHAGFAGTTGVAVLAVAIATYFVVNAVLVIPGVSGDRRDLRSLFGDWTDNLLEFATLCLGGLLAVVLAVLPAVAVLVLPPLFLSHRAVLITRLESAARRDDKTGVWNAAGWHRIASQELRTGARCGVLMVDLDNFKRVNDTHGHLAGDAVLKAVAETIRESVRHRDAVGRFGGEEFVVLLPGLDGEDVRVVAERIRGAIGRLRISFQQRRIDGLSASIGAATYPVSGTAVERLIQVADAAMYRAKATGRNRVVSVTDAGQ